MFREFLAGSPHLAGPVVALVIFFVLFLGVLWGLVRGIARRRSFDRISALPLEEERSARAEGGSIR
jgi:hypothetical protein